ncbi:hypothetical protein ACFL3Q_16865 [Planctomycetota bacterium]
MYRKMLFGRTLWWSVKLVMCLALGYFLMLFTYEASQGPNFFIDMGNGYFIGSWPGTLTYWKPEENKDFENPLPGSIEAFNIQGPWVIGKTRVTWEVEWFAIHTLKHEVHYPLVSEVEVGGIIGRHVTESDLVTNPFPFFVPWRYQRTLPWTPPCVSFVMVIYFTLMVIFFLKRRYIKRRPKANLI